MSIPVKDIPKEYQFLTKEIVPLHLAFALGYYGLKEIEGEKSNPVILEMADALNVQVGSFYNNDDTPWCAIFAGFVLKNCGEDYPKGYDAMRAKSYQTIGIGQRQAMLGDMLILERDGGGHVCFYVGEDDWNFHVLGGNQKNMVCIVPIEKSRVIAIRRMKKVYDNPPANLRRVFITSDQKKSVNEA